MTIVSIFSSIIYAISVLNFLMITIKNKQHLLLYINQLSNIKQTLIRSIVFYKSLYYINKKYN